MLFGSRYVRQSDLSKARQMRRQRITQQGIVFGIFVLPYDSVSLLLAGDAGRATGAGAADRPNGHSVPETFAAIVVLPIGLGLIDGWPVAYAEEPSFFTTLSAGRFMAGLRQAFSFQRDVVQWSETLAPVAWIDRGAVPGVPMPIITFALATHTAAFFLRRTQLGAYLYATGDNSFGARATNLTTQPAIALQYLLAALIVAFTGAFLGASINSIPTRVYNATLIYDVVLVRLLGGIGLSGGRGGVLTTVVGTLLIGTILNAMTILFISYSY
jgi:ribose transport system permease protein